MSKPILALAVVVLVASTAVSILYMDDHDLPANVTRSAAAHYEIGKPMAQPPPPHLTGQSGTSVPTAGGKQATYVVLTHPDTLEPVKDVIVIAADREAPDSVWLSSDAQALVEGVATDNAGTAFVGYHDIYPEYLHCYDRVEKEWVHVVSVCTADASVVRGVDHLIITVYYDFGPTYYINMQIPDGYVESDFSFRLCRGSSAFPALGSLRTGLPSWIRFVGASTRPSGTVGSTVWVVSAESSDALWHGAQYVSRDRAHNNSVLDITLEAMAGLSGKILDQSGAPVSSAQIILESRALPGDSRGVYSDQDGYFQVAACPGRYLVYVHTQEQTFTGPDLTLEAGKTTYHEIPIATNESECEVSGVITSVSGTYCKPTTVLITPGLAMCDVVWARESERMVGRFSAHCEATADEYAVTILSAVHSHRWSPRRVRIGPGGCAEFVLRDDDPGVALCLAVVDEESGSDKLSTVHIRYELSDSDGVFGRTEVQEGVGHRLLPARIFDDECVRVEIRARGRIPVLLNRSSFVLEACAMDTASLHASITLKSGVGIIVYVVDGSGMPVSGIRVGANNTLCAVSDERGCLVLDMGGVTSGTIRILSPQWVIMESGDVLGDGTVRRSLSEDGMDELLLVVCAS